MAAKRKPSPRKKAARREPQSDDATTQRFEALVDALIANSEIDDTAEYLRRGRAFASLAVDALNPRWTAAFRRCVASRNSEHMRLLNDLSAELRLRGLEPPADTVEPELDTVRAEMAAEGPDNSGVREAVRKFFEARNKPQA